MSYRSFSRVAKIINRSPYIIRLIFWFLVWHYNKIKYTKAQIVTLKLIIPGYQFPTLKEYCNFAKHNEDWRHSLNPLVRNYNGVSWGGKVNAIEPAQISDNAVTSGKISVK